MTEKKETPDLIAQEERTEVEEALLTIARELTALKKQTKDQVQGLQAQIEALQTKNAQLESQLKKHETAIYKEYQPVKFPPKEEIKPIMPQQAQPSQKKRTFMSDFMSALKGEKNGGIDSSRTP
ncbi:hypothetical protein HGA88_02260 [Candidatus Roizmanbacteria bacterium]|nr:hypothetical protein [Candidatus Roizmanbacteria bacterium]